MQRDARNIDDCKKEIIILDAKLISVIDVYAFRAELSNGHGLAAFLRREDRALVGMFHVGDVVKVRMSPYDMSQGQIIYKEV